MEGLVAVNGKITTPDDAQIPVIDRGFLFGDNVFEVFVAFGPTLLDDSAHLERLRSSAAAHRMTIPWSNEELIFEMKALLEATGFDKSYLRLIVTRGSGLGLSTSEQLSPNKVIFCLPAKKEPASVFEKGLKILRKQSGGIERGASAKTGNYLRSITALDEAKQAGFDDVLWTNSEGEITEISTANIFLIGREGDLVEIATPPANSGLLLGITRHRIMNLLQNAKIKVTERIITSDELPRFDEAFVCSTVRGLVPLASIDNHRLHSTRENAVFHHIKRLYLTWVQTEVGYAVDWNTGAKI